MDDATTSQQWAQGDHYEAYVGRWSRLVARRFLEWLELPGHAAWIDVGCGTGALSATILERSDPKQIQAIDSSRAYLDAARTRLNDGRVRIEWGDAQKLPVQSGAYDAAVSGLVLNFVPEPLKMVLEMKQAVGPGGTVALYVWDYAGKMQLMRYFWDAAAALDRRARELDEGRHFPVCDPQALRQLFLQAGLSAVDVIPIEVETHFRDFNDYWMPFEGGQGPAPAYAMSLSEAARQRLRERIRNALPFAPDGSIPLVARAWAVRGVKE